MLLVKHKKPLSEKAKMRILLAKDVLKYLEANKIYARHNYFNANYIGKDIPKSGSLKTLLSKSNTTCDVCALGSLFYSYIRRFNNFNINNITKTHFSNYISNGELEINNRDDLILKLKKYFSPDQLQSIENDYELNYFSPKTEDHEMMRLIMINIISNNGKYIPIKETEC